MTLIDRELVSVFGESNGDQIPVFAERAQEELTAREVRVAAREREVEASEERQRRWAWRLRLMERELEVRDQRIEFASSSFHVRPNPASRPARQLAIDGWL